MEPKRLVTRVATSAAAVAVALAMMASHADAQVGHGCSVFNPCNKGFSCQPGSQRCYNSPRQEGQPCSAGYGCATGLRCVPGTQKCVSAAAPATGVIEKGLSQVGATIPASCPDMALRCPTGESFSRGTSWDAGSAMCRPNTSIEVTLRAKCTSPWVGQRLNEKDLDVGWWKQAAQASACSAPGILSQVDSELFNDACVIHDMCYRSQTGKAACDIQFLTNQQAVCYKLGVPSSIGVGGCLAMANNNYAVVVKLGQRSYDDDQRAYGLRR